VNENEKLIVPVNDDGSLRWMTPGELGDYLNRLTVNEGSDIMSRYTPGPWEAVFPAAIDWCDPMVYGHDRKSRVAWMAGGGPDRAITAVEARANACLIAAAPDLLAACLRMLDSWGTQDEDEVIASRDSARAAVEKAIGGQAHD
jgi:hypothetical protein